MKYKGWVVYNQNDVERNMYFIKSLKAEAAKYNIDLRLKIREDFVIGINNYENSLFYGGRQVQLPNFAIMRSRDSFFSKQLELCGIKVFNNSTVSEICNDKAKTHQFLGEYRIPTLNTIFTNVGDCKKNYMDFDYPKVVKEVGGHGGTAVFLVESDLQFKSILSTFNNNMNLIIQEQSKVIGKDLRVYMLGKRIISSILRTSQNGDFRANYSLGGHTELYNLSRNEERIVTSITTLLNADYIGIDFLFNEDGTLLLNEIEDVVGARMLYQHTDINIAQLYVEYIVEKINGY